MFKKNYRTLIRQCAIVIALGLMGASSTAMASTPAAGGADIEQDEDGNTPLMLAVSKMPRSYQEALNKIGYIASTFSSGKWLNIIDAVNKKGESAITIAQALAAANPHEYDRYAPRMLEILLAAQKEQLAYKERARAVAREEEEREQFMANLAAENARIDKIMQEAAVEQQKEEHLQAVKLAKLDVAEGLQKFARGRKARKQVHNLRQARAATAQTAAAQLAVERATRSAALVARKNTAATKIQAHVRGNRGRAQVATHHAGATTIQKITRGHKARTHVAKLKAKLAREEAAAIKIQATIRGRRGRKALEAQRELKAAQVAAEKTQRELMAAQAAADEEAEMLALVPTIPAPSTPALPEPVAATEEEPTTVPAVFTDLPAVSASTAAAGGAGAGTGTGTGSIPIPHSGPIGLVGTSGYTTKLGAHGETTQAADKFGHYKGIMKLSVVDQVIADLKTAGIMAKKPGLKKLQYNAAITGRDLSQDERNQIRDAIGLPEE